MTVLVGRRIVWRVATVADVHAETPTAVTILLDVPDWPGHVAGQHVDVRLTAEDGYQAERSYSIASAPEDGRVALTVERIEDGEVSPYLAGELRAGDELELRGPVGGHFTWRVEDGGPLLLVAGGSGLVPLMAMLRHRASAGGSDVDARLLLSARRPEDVLYREQLEALAAAPDGPRVHVTLTRAAGEGAGAAGGGLARDGAGGAGWPVPAAWTGWERRVDAGMLADVGPAPSQRPRVFVCGPTSFVESVADLLVALGHAPEAIHAERFGPTG